MEKEDQRIKKDAHPVNEGRGESTFYLTLNDDEENDMPTIVAERTPELGKLVKPLATPENEEGNSLTVDATFPKGDSFQRYCQSSILATRTVAVCMMPRVQNMS